jgi:endonuclease/exonuclease/phosphatase family metal-dependent hydrolase
LEVQRVNLTVMSLNLRVDSWLDFGNRWTKRVRSLQGQLQAHQPDIFGTQEALPHMLRHLDVRLPNYAHVGTGRTGDDTGEHCAVFYRTDRLTLVHHDQFWLSTTPNVPSTSWGSAYPRVCTWAQFEFVESPQYGFVVYNTHLDHVSCHARLHSTWLIWRTISQKRAETGLPIVLLGDFNATPHEQTIRFLRGEFVIEGQHSDLVDAADFANEPIGRTFHRFRGGFEGHPIDYIYVSPDVRVDSVKLDRARYHGKYPSDHYPVIAGISVPGPLSLVP